LEQNKNNVKGMLAIGMMQALEMDSRTIAQPIDIAYVIPDSILPAGPPRNGCGQIIARSGAAGA
jgi:hypothetical protein